MLPLIGFPMPPPGESSPLAGMGVSAPPPGIAALMARLGQGRLPQPPETPEKNPLDMLMPFLAGSGFQNILGSITKFMKILTTTGERTDKSVRVPMQGNVGDMDRMAAQQMMAQQVMPGPTGMPMAGPANLPVRIGP